MDDIDDSVDDNDLIQLSAYGINTEWHWPIDQIECPVRRCEKFTTRSDAIIHFKKKHAKHAIFCEYEI